MIPNCVLNRLMKYLFDHQGVCHRNAPVKYFITIAVIYLYLLFIQLGFPLCIASSLHYLFMHWVSVLSHVNFTYFELLLGLYSSLWVWSRYEAFVYREEQVEKVAAGLLEHLLLHLPGINDLCAKGLDANFNLNRPENLQDVEWFTKATVKRFLSKISLFSRYFAF